MMPRILKDMTEEEIKEACCLRYGKVATNPTGSYNFPIGRDFAVSVGYSQKLILDLPIDLETT